MKKRNDKCLAEGELTGHAHVAVAETAAVYGNGTTRLLVCPDGTDVTHEEHGTQTLPPGEYEITRQRESDPDSEAVRAVRD